MVLLPRRFGRGLAAGLTFVALFALPGVAFADLPRDCPAAPAAYSGDDPVVAALSDQRGDERAACLAVTDRLDRAHTDALAAHDDSTAAQAAAHVDAAAAHSDASSITDAVNAIPTPIPPAAAAEYHGPTATQVDDAARAVHGDLWLLLGAGAALLFGVPFLRMATPWWRS